MQGSYLPAVGRELQKVTAATMEHVGWLSYDAGWQDRARRWWLETCHFTDVADVPDVRAMTLVTMALQASNVGTGAEVVDLIQAARKTATRDQKKFPLLSLMATREAFGHAQAGERGAAVTALGEAHQWLDRGRRGDEPFWLDFWGPADLAWHETQVALATGQGKLAEAAARAALARVDAVLFPRNHTLYTAGLGVILAQRGQLDEAISVTTAAIQECTRGGVPAAVSLACTALLTCSGSRPTPQRPPSRLPPDACCLRRELSRCARGRRARRARPAGCCA